MSELKMPPPKDMEDLLKFCGIPSRDAVHRLWPNVYDELRRLAADFLQRERRDHTLDPTGLVHEAYVRLINQRTAGWNDQSQFFAVAAKVMRRILVDHARSHRAAKRGGGKPTTGLDEAVNCFEQRAVDLVALDAALQALGDIDERKSRVVELRFFGGLSLDETAKVLDVSLRTVERDWTMAKAWLRTEIGDP
jgi:RNA polymerase sigma factor (TIGR02999 family)